MPVYLALQPIRRAASRIAAGPGELLPRLFTLTRGGQCPSGGRFLSRYSAVTDSFPLESMVLCVARTFLSPLYTSASDWTVLLLVTTKLQKLFCSHPLLPLFLLGKSAKPTVQSTVSTGSGSTVTRVSLLTRAFTFTIDSLCILMQPWERRPGTE